MSFDEYSSVYEAIREKDIEAVKYFIAEGEVDYGGWSWNALHEACKGENIEIIKLLLEKAKIPANTDFELIDDSSDYRGSALTEALLNGNLDIAKLLIQFGADVNASYYSEDRDTLEYFFGSYDLVTDKGNCLGLALCYDNDELIHLMLEKGLDIDATDDQDKTNLYHAIFNSNLNHVSKLLDIGSDVNQVMNESDLGYGDLSALMFAVLQYSPKNQSSHDIIKLLLNNGASIEYEALDCEEETVLDLVFDKNDAALDLLLGLQGLRNRFTKSEFEDEVHGRFASADTQLDIPIINEQDWNRLPESAQQEVYDFFLFIKQRYAKQTD